MTLKTGQTLPAGTLTTMTPDGPGPIDIKDYFKNRTLAIFSVPGAFTPTCSARHLPGFLEKLDDLKAQGIDEVACYAVNDAFVMHAWAEKNDAVGKITMLSDGSADFTKKIGLDVDLSDFGMGTRSQRFSMLVKDLTVTHLFVDAPGAFEVSSAEYMLEALKK